jgi:hypothetical protein
MSLVFINPLYMDALATKLELTGMSLRLFAVIQMLQNDLSLEGIDFEEVEMAQELLSLSEKLGIDSPSLSDVSAMVEGVCPVCYGSGSYSVDSSDPEQDGYEQKCICLILNDNE